MIKMILVALLGLILPCVAVVQVVDYALLSYPGDGCPDYTLDHVVSATLDIDIQTLTEKYIDPVSDPEDLAFNLFGQRYLRLDQPGQDPTIVRVFFTYGGYTVLKICVFDHQLGAEITILKSNGGVFQSQDLTDSKIILRFLPESFYGNRVVLSAGFSLGSRHTDNELATNVLWSYLSSAVHAAQAKYGAYPCDFEYRTNSGFCNNVARHDFGAINQPMLRLRFNDPDPRWLKETDGVPADTSRPSARKISNNLMNQIRSIPNSAGVNMLWLTFGQFVDHDIALTLAYGPESPQHQEYNIPVRPDDKHFFDIAGDVNCKNTYEYDGKYKSRKSKDEEDDSSAPVCKYPSIAFFRSERFLNKGVPVEPFVQYNAQTSYLDLSTLYGNTAAKFKFLRSYKDGMLKTSQKGNWLPGNGHEGVGLELAVEAEHESTAPVAGDRRVNEQPYLTMMHVLWMREHNKVAYELHELFPHWTDERLFQEARKITIAEYQVIVYQQWLPFLLGANSLGPYQGYKSCVNPASSIFFATCAFRFGHSMVTEELKVADYYLRDLLSLPIEETLFKSELFDNEFVNTDTLFMGAHKLIAEENDAQIQDALRNHLFSKFKEGSSPGFDLPAANIQRCRDHACPSWSDARKSFDLPLPRSWIDLTSILQTPQDAYKVFYTYGPNSLFNLDPFPLGLMEKKVPGSLLGSLFHRAVSDQFFRLREGDRFYYENIHVNCDVTDRYPRITNILKGEVSMKDIFLRNFDRQGDNVALEQLEKILPTNVFISPDHNICSPPLAIMLPTISNHASNVGCPGEAERIERFFWDAYKNQSIKVSICDIDSELVNNLKGFTSPDDAAEICAPTDRRSYRSRNEPHA